MHAVEVVADADGGVVERKFAAIVGEIIVAGEMKPQIAHGLIRHAVGFARARHDFRGGEIRRAGVVAGEDASADFGQRLPGGRLIVVVRAAGPDGVLVELQAFLGGAAKHHRGEPAVADGQRLDPLACGLRIPEKQRIGAARSYEDGKKGETGGGEFFHGVLRRVKFPVEGDTKQASAGVSGGPPRGSSQRRSPRQVVDESRIRLAGAVPARPPPNDFGRRENRRSRSSAMDK